MSNNIYLDGTAINSDRSVVVVITVVIIIAKSIDNKCLPVTTLSFRKNRLPFYFYNKFPKCKPFQLIFGRNIAEEI